MHGRHSQQRRSLKGLCWQQERRAERDEESRQQVRRRRWHIHSLSFQLQGTRHLRLWQLTCKRLHKQTAIFALYVLYIDFSRCDYRLLLCPFFQERTDNQTPRQWETKNIEFSVKNGAVKVHKCANEWLGFRLVHFCRYYAHYNLLMMRARFPFCIMFLYANAFKSTVWWSTLIKLIPSLCLLVLGWRKWGYGVVAREWWWDLIFRWGLWHFSGFTKNKTNRKKKTRLKSQLQDL